MGDKDKSKGGGQGTNDGSKIHYTDWTPDGTRRSWDEDRRTGRVTRDHSVDQKTGEKRSYPDRDR